ncbi:hypothetical protein H2248_012420 [Termitomyces sp. 'cryptogamus']|nr:hypothetical protein H2248_012420 [Termitomyces sp. 'cryptogamus']
MAVFHHHPLMAFDISPLNITAATTPDSPNTHLQPAKHVLDIDHPLFMQTKHMQSLYSALASTILGSFLISKIPVTSATPIANPVLEAAPKLPEP